MKKYAGVLLVTPGGKLIMQRRDNNPGIENPGKVTTFGGGIDGGETPREAAVREIEEELSLKLDEDDLLDFGVYQKTKERHGSDAICHIFMAKSINPDVLRVNEGLGLVLVAADDNLDELNLSILATDILSDYFSSR